MQYLDARRLTGPNVLWDKPGAILDIRCSRVEAEALLPFCEVHLRRMLEAVGWADEAITHLHLAGGLSIAFSAPIDALYAASEINEWLWTCCDAEWNDAETPDFETSADAIRAAIAEEVNPPLLALADAAGRHDVAFLWDDDEVSVGHGRFSTTWPFRELPAPESLDWKAFRDVPVGIVTGTNGKTTTVRMAKHILQSAGRSVGLSCTDWVSVNDRIVDRDDWSGPGGARMVLRQPDVDTAILETARGGLLRRGLGVDRADVALITNIAEDHLGDYGSQNLDELLNIKWVVSHAVVDKGTLVLNADDSLLVERAQSYTGSIDWFTLDADNELAASHVEAGGTAFVYDDGVLQRRGPGGTETIAAARDIPVTLDGAALHNVANALAAAALVARLGLDPADIRAGLESMTQAANPGRSNLFEIDGFRVLVDFAHNPEAMQALFSMAEAVPAKRRAICFGQAGDRTDAQIRELAAGAWEIGIDLFVISELADYARGRESGEVFGIMKRELKSLGASDAQIRHYDEERESFAAALEWAEPGDLVVMLDLGRNSGIREQLETRAQSG